MENSKVTPRTLTGFMELLPDEQILFDQIKQTILDISKYTKVEHRVVPNDNSVDIISDLSK